MRRGRTLRDSPIVRGALVMSTERRTLREDTDQPCSKCGATMKNVVTIAPVAGERGLIAYECPKCGHLTSVLVSPAPNI
jgi:predicted nucleic acid-binding Zn ribbon protein